MTETAGEILGELTTHNNLEGQHGGSTKGCATALVRLYLMKRIIMEHHPRVSVDVGVV